PAGALQASVVSHDEPAPWGVSVYTSRDGESCAVVGQVNGLTLGEYAGGKVHAYLSGTKPGVCKRLDAKHPIDWDTFHAPNRTIVYGRARPGVKRVIVTVDGVDHPAPTGRGGAFALVFRGKASVTALLPG